MIWLLLTKPRGGERWGIESVFFDNEPPTQREMQTERGRGAAMRNQMLRGTGREVRLVGFEMKGMVTEAMVRRRDPYWKEPEEPGEREKG